MRDDIELENQEQDAIEQTLDELIEELRTESMPAVCKVYRQPAGNTSRQEWLFDFEPGTFSVSELQHKLQTKYGPGTYRIRVYIRDEETNKIKLAPGGNRVLHIGAPDPAAAPVGGIDLAGVLQELRKIQFPQSSDQSGILVQMVQMMHQQNMLLLTQLLQRSRENTVEQVREMLGIARELQMLEPPEEESFGQTMLRMVREYAPQILKLTEREQALRAQVAQAILQPKHEEENPVMDLDRFISFIRPHLSEFVLALKAGLDPKMIASELYDRIPDNYLELATREISRAEFVSDLIGKLPQLSEYKNALEKIREEIAALLKEDGFIA